MIRRSRIWLGAVVLVNVINLAGAGIAAADHEPLHAGVHVVLLLLGVYVMQRLRAGRSIWGPSESPTLSGELTDRLANIEQAVDAVAIEVERIGEGQRFMTRLFTENDTPRTAGEGDAEPIEIEAKDLAPRGRPRTS